MQLLNPFLIAIFAPTIAAQYKAPTNERLITMDDCGVETAPPASSLKNTKWDKPDFVLPKPSLKFLFHLECNMQSFINIGDGPHGNRSSVIFKGGRFEGPNLRGEILPGGGDWEIIRNHDGDQQTAHLDTRYNLRTHDGAAIYLRTTGTRTGKREVLESLGEKEVSSSDYRMRLHITAETGHERYSWLNTAVIVAYSGRVKDMVIYNAYQLM